MRITDDAGRVLEVRRLSAIEEFDAAARIGRPGDSAAWWGIVKQVCAVRTIDGSLVHTPASRGEINTLKKRLGPEGVRAVLKVFAQEQQDEAADVAPAKLVFRIADEVEIIDMLEIGGALADVVPWRGLAFTACGVREVDGTTFAFPSSMEDLRAAVKRLDDPAVMKALTQERELFVDSPAQAGDEAERAKN
jgi:hypothetical protein